MNTILMIILAGIAIIAAITIIYYVLRFFFDFLWYIGSRNLALIPGGLYLSSLLKKHFPMPNIYFSIGVTIGCIVLSVLAWLLIKKIWSAIDSFIVCKFVTSRLGSWWYNHSSNRYIAIAHGYDENKAWENSTINTLNERTYDMKDFLS